MRQYLNTLKLILEEGTWQSNRTGVKAISVPGAMMKFDLARGFPALTTKKLAFRSMAAELVCFIRGYTNAADFRAMGCNWWDANANQNDAWLANPHRKGNDDLGRVYGAQWRNWEPTSVAMAPIDQLANAIKTIQTDPTNRRIIINAWNPGEMDKMALPPCHILYQFIVNVQRRELNMCMYQRSCDMFLGVPMNIASASLLMTLVARATGYFPRHFTHFLADAHIYENHVDQVKEQLARKPFKLPKLQFRDEMDGRVVAKNQGLKFIESFNPIDVVLENYKHHPPIAAPMAV